mgnify:CR=1 FL=1
MEEIEEKFIGKVTHYFPKVEAAIVKLEDNLKIGDKVKFKRGEEEFEQKVQSMQIEHQDIRNAKKGQEIGLKVDQKVKESWEVYKV